MPDEPYDFSKMPSQRQPQLRLPRTKKGVRLDGVDPRLTDFAAERNLVVTSGKDGAHNTGSRHYSGNAVDIRVRDKTPEEAERIMSEARSEGLNVLDERTRPAGQKVYGGPNLHISVGTQKPAYDFSKMPSQQSEQFDFSQLPSQQVPPTATPAVIPAESSTSPTPQPSIGQAGVQTSAPATNSPWAAGIEPDPLDETLRSTAPPRSAQSNEIERKALPIDTPEQIPAISPYGDRVEPTDKPGSVRVVNEEREAQVAAQRKRVRRAERAVGRARRQLRTAQSLTPGHLLSDDPNVQQDREYGAWKMGEGGQGTQPQGLSGVFAGDGSSDGRYRESPVSTGELAASVRELSERHRREQAKLDEMLRTARVPVASVLTRAPSLARAEEATQRNVEQMQGARYAEENPEEAAIARMGEESSRSIEGQMQAGSGLERAVEHDLDTRSAPERGAQQGAHAAIADLAHRAANLLDIVSGPLWKKGAQYGVESPVFGDHLYTTKMEGPNLLKLASPEALPFYRGVSSFLRNISEGSEGVSRYESPNDPKSGALRFLLHDLPKGGTETGAMILELATIRRLTGVPLSTIMGAQAAVSSLDNPKQIVPSVGQGILLGKFFDAVGGLGYSRPANVVINAGAGFTLANLEGKKPNEVLADTLLFGGLGALHSGDRSIARDVLEGRTPLPESLRARVAARLGYEPVTVLSEDGRYAAVDFNPKTSEVVARPITEEQARERLPNDVEEGASPYGAPDILGRVRPLPRFVRVPDEVFNGMFPKGADAGSAASANPDRLATTPLQLNEKNAAPRDAHELSEALGGLRTAPDEQSFAKAVKRAVTAGATPEEIDSALRDVQTPEPSPESQEAAQPLQTQLRPQSAQEATSVEEISHADAPVRTDAGDAARSAGSATRRSDSQNGSATPLSNSEVAVSPSQVQPTETDVETSAPREFHHTDFGTVVEAENQKGVSRGSVRVVDPEGSEHVIQEPNGRGEGNQKAVRVRHRGIYIKPRVGADAGVAEKATSQGAEVARTGITEKEAEPTEDPRVTEAAQFLNDFIIKRDLRHLEGEHGRQFTPERLAEVRERASSRPVSDSMPWARKLVSAVDERDPAFLQTVIGDGNAASRKLFTKLTGVKLGKSQTEDEAAVRSYVGAEKYDAYKREQSDKSAAESEKRASNAAREAERRVLDVKVSHNNREMTTKEFIDSIIADGYTDLEEKQKGVATAYTLWKHDEQGRRSSGYPFKKKAEASYIQRTLAEAKPAQQSKRKPETSSSSSPAQPFTGKLEKGETVVETYATGRVVVIHSTSPANMLGGHGREHWVLVDRKAPGVTFGSSRSGPSTLEDARTQAKEEAYVIETLENAPPPTYAKIDATNAAEVLRGKKPETSQPVKSNEQAKPSVSQIFDEEFDSMFGEEMKAKSLKDVATGLNDLFGGSPLKSARAEEFDEEKYLQAKTLFEAGIKHSGGDLSDVRASVKGLLSSLRSQFDMEPRVIQRMKPYIVRFIEESETAKEETGLQAGTRKLIDAIKERLRSEGIKDNPQLTRMADEAFGGTRAQGVYGPKDAYDALEVAVNELLSEDAKRLMAVDPKAALGELRALLKKLPTQTDRTTEQQELQQFSTPPTEAFVAAKALSPTPDDVVLEPSAGTGSLALWPKAVGAKVYANEIAPRRQALLKEQGYETTSVDAQFLDDLLPENIQPTAVLMNPPFSSTGGRVAKNKTIYGAEHVTDALKRLSDGGRLVAIVGEGMGLDRPAFREWWSRVFKEYNVRANISVPGEEFGKYGTTVDNQLVVIDKTGPTPGETLAEQTANVITASPRDLEGVLDAIEPIIADRPLAQARRDIRRSGGRPAVEAETHRSPEPVGAREKPGRVANEDTRRQTGQSRTRVPQAESTDEPRPSGEDTTPDGSGGDDLGLRQQLKFERNTEEREDDSANFVTYRPAKLKGGVKHPGLIVESASMAAVDPPDITYSPKLDPKIVSEGKLSDLQYEAVSYSGQRHEQRLPDGRRAAMFIGDGTGVGKGRILAGITLDNWNRGRRRVVWMSVNTDLVPSTERDLRDLGAAKIPLAVINDFSAQSPQLDFGDGVLFVAYPTLVKTAQNGQTRFDQIRDWLGDDGLILLDEAHLAKNAVTEGMKESSQRGEKIVALQEGEKTNPNWRFVYASATGATEVANMGYMSRLGLWGDGTSFPGGFAEFKSAIDGGGVGAMEMVSRDMKAMGMYTARTLSFKGVTCREAVHSLTPTQRELYDTAAKAWQVVLQNVNRALDITNADSRAKMHARRRFWNDQQRFFRQFITALKVPTAIREIDKALEEGSSVVLGLYGTGEARTKEQVKKALAVGSDLEDLDFSPKEILRNLVAKAFPTQRYTEQSDPSNPKKIIKVPVVDSDGRPVESAQAKAMRDRLLEELDKLALPENPLDQIVNHFGPDRVAEITGRSKRLVRNPETGKNEYVKRVSGVSMEKASQHEMDAFQEGRKRIAIISASASTGISLHADNTRANKERRAHITLETGWSADIQMQTFGRTHRSNEASQPEYVLLATDVGGEKRFLSTIAKRLASLGALTKGERKATGMGSGEEGLEKYDFMNDYGRAAIHDITNKVKMNRGPEGVNSADTWERMGLVKKTDKGTEFEEPDVERFLNRILALGLDEQNRMFDWFTETFNRVVAQAKESGTFDEGVMDIKGDAVRMTAEPQVVATDKTTGAETVHYQMEVDERTKPVEFESLAGKKGEFYKQNRSGNIIFAEESGSRTDAAGRVYRRYYVTLPRASRDHLIEQQDLAGKYTQVKSDEAKSLWDVEYGEVPKVRTKEVHLIGGAIIPVWQRLQQRDQQGNAVQLKVVRMATDEGRRVVGVRIPTKSVGAVLKAIGVQRSFKEPSAIFNSVYEQGETVKLVSGLSLERVRFKGDDAVELKGADRYKINELKGMGLRHEIVNYDDRLFVPTNEKTGIEVLTKLLERYPAMSEDAPLKMARADEKSLEALRDADFHELVPQATVKRDGHLLEVNAEGHEILRRAFEQRQIETGALEPEGEPAESSFDGVFLKPEQIKQTATTLRAAAKELLTQGYPKESAEKLNSLAAKLTRAGLVGGKQSGKNTAIVYVYDEAVPHEEFHRAGYVGAMSEALASRHANFTELASHPVIQKAWDSYFSRVSGYSRLDEALLVEETASWIAGGKANVLGLTEEEASDYLRQWFESYAERNGVDALKNFEEVTLPHVNEIIGQVRRGRPQSGRSAEGVQSSKGGVPEEPQRTARSEEQGDKASSQESSQEEVRHRRLPSTLREMGLRAADELYEVYPNRAANRDAKALFEKLGFEGSENLLRNVGQMGAEHVQLSKILQRALLGEASKVSETDVEQATMLRQRAQDLASDLAARFTKGGQFIQAADSVESSVEDVMATAVKVAKERGRDLTPKEASEIHRAGEQLETSTATLEVSAIQARDAREAVKGDEEEIARAEAGELSPDEVKGIKDRLKRLRERERELSEREKRRTAEGAKLTEQLAKQRETLASLREKEKRRERNIAEMEGRLPERKERSKSPSARQRAAQSLSMDESSLVAEVMAALGQRPLMMARAESDTATPNQPKPLSDDTISKLARLGAIRLLRAERGKYSVQDFRRDILSDFGPQVEPHLDAIHAEAVSVMRSELRRANIERRLESIKAREGNEDLSRGELMEIAEREKEERRRASLVQAEHEKVAKAFESKDEREAKAAKRESKDEFRKSQSFVKDIARKASRVFQRTVGGRDVGSKALAQAIARNASTDIEAIAAAKLSTGISPSEFASQMKAEHGLDKKGLHAAFKSGAEVLEKARADINTSRQMATALKNASKATTQAERDRALVELQEARAKRRQAQAGVARQLRRIRRGRVKAIASEVFKESKGVPIALMASGDMSSFLRQGGIVVAMQPSLAPAFTKSLVTNIGQAGHAKNIDAIESDSDFSLSQRSGVDYSTAGKGGGHEEFFENAEVIKRVPLLRTWVEKSDQVFSGSLDGVRLSLFKLLASDLRSKGVNYESRPTAYRDIARFVNIVTGRADVGDRNAALTKAYLYLGRAIGFAPRYRVSRLQFLTLPFNRSFWEADPSARRVIYKNYARWLGTMGAVYAVLAALGYISGGLISTAFNPDDDDFLKLKVGKARFDLTGGLQVPARFLGRLLLEGYRGLTGQVTPDMAAKQMGEATKRYLESGLDPRASLAWEAFKGKTYDQKPFTWFGDYGIDGAIGTRLLPINITQAVETGRKEGKGLAAAQFAAEFLGAGTQVYPDRPDEPVTTAEKLAARFSERDYGNAKPLDEQTKRKLDELKTRARKGEDVSDELDPLVSNGVITSERADAIAHAKDQTYLEEKFRQLSLDDKRHVIKYANSDEKKLLEPILRRAEADKGASLSDEAKKAYTSAGKEFYHAPSKLKLAGKDRKLSDDERTRLDNSVSENFERVYKEFLNPQDDEARKDLEEYRSADRAGRRKVLDRLQRRALNSAHGEFRSEWVDSHSDELDAEEGYKFTDEEKSEMQRQSGAASEKSVSAFLNPQTMSQRRALEEYEKASPSEQRKMLDGVRREAIEGARSKFKQSRKSKLKVSAYPMFRPQVAA